MIFFGGGGGNPDDFLHEAIEMVQRKQPKIAMSLLKKALKVDPKHVEVLYNLGLVQNQLKKYQDAITSFDKILEINPDDAPALNNRAIAMGESGDVNGCLLYTSPSPRD